MRRSIMTEYTTQFFIEDCNDEEISSLREMKYQISEHEFLRTLKIEDEYILRYLWSSSMDVSSSMQKLLRFHKAMDDFPEWVPRQIPKKPKSLVPPGLISLLDGRDRDGRVIWISRLADVDFTRIKLIDIVRAVYIWVEFLQLQSFDINKNGGSVVVDLSNVGWSILTLLTPHNLKTCLKLLEAFPCRSYLLHIVNESPIMHIGIRMIWPFLSDTLKEIIKFHLKDFASLHEYIDPEILPIEFGGIQEFDSSKNRKKMFQSLQHIDNTFKKYRVFNDSDIP